MTMRRTPVLIAATCAAVLGIAACGAGGSGSGSGQSGNPKTFGVNATGVVHFWAREATDPVAKALVAQFNATHKHLKVVLHLTQPNEAVTELGTAIRAGAVPDLVGLNDIGPEPGSAAGELPANPGRRQEDQRARPRHLRFLVRGGLPGLPGPFQAILVPLFVEMHVLHLLNSLPGLALFYTAFNLPFGVYVMRNSFSQIPRDITDAAKVDGASPMSTLVTVLRPLILPGMATTALYAFLFAWTEFLAALTFLTDDGLFTLPVALINVEAGTYGRINYGLLLSGSVIAMIPCVVVFVALQRYYLRGLISGGSRADGDLGRRGAR